MSIDEALKQEGPLERFLRESNLVLTCLERGMDDEEAYHWSLLKSRLEDAYQDLSPEHKSEAETDYFNLRDTIDIYLKAGIPNLDS